MLHLVAAIAMTGAIKTPEVKTEWTKQTYELQTKMVKSGMNKTIATEIINECKKQAGKNDARRCVLAGFAISMNETQGFKTAYKHSGFGIQKAYNSDSESIKDWVKKYFKFWFKWKDGSHFYGSPKKKAPTRYCMSEESSGTVGWCKNGREHFDIFISKLK